MSERNERVAKLLAADAPAARDFAFELKVMARIERRHFVRSVARNIAIAALAVLVLALLAPAIETWPGLMDRWSPTRLPATDLLAAATLILSAGLALWQAKLARDT